MITTMTTLPSVFKFQIFVFPHFEQCLRTGTGTHTHERCAGSLLIYTLTSTRAKHIYITMTTTTRTTMLIMCRIIRITQYNDNIISCFMMHVFINTLGFGPTPAPARPLAQFQTHPLHYKNKLKVCSNPVPTTQHAWHLLLSSFWCCMLRANCTE